MESTPNQRVTGSCLQFCFVSLHLSFFRKNENVRGAGVFSGEISKRQEAVSVALPHFVGILVTRLTLRSGALVRGKGGS